MPTLSRSKSAQMHKAIRKTVKKPFKFELTSEDIALDNAISTAAARSLAKRSA